MLHRRPRGGAETTSGSLCPRSFVSRREVAAGRGSLSKPRSPTLPKAYDERRLELIVFGALQLIRARHARVPEVEQQLTQALIGMTTPQLVKCGKNAVDSRWVSVHSSSERGCSFTSP